MALVDPTRDENLEKHTAAAAAEAPKDDNPAPEVPDKLKGKSPEEVYEMYLNAEKDRSRMANELGEVRGMADRLLKIEEARAAGEGSQDPVQEVTIDPTELLADPTATISKYFETREAKLREEYDSKIQALEGAVSGTSLTVRHNDAQQILNSEEFIEYCKGDPFRLRAAQMGAAGDQEALVELINSYKAANESHSGDPEGQAPARRSTAPVFEGSATGDAPAPKGEIIKRTDIIKKKLEDPEGYLDPAYQQHIQQAYLEGRVK